MTAILDDFRNYIIQQTGADAAPRKNIPSSAPQQAAHNEAPARLTVLKQKASACTACQLSGSRTNLVFGAGNPAAGLMLIGEAPGYYEDMQGEPFVGKAGQLLNKMFTAIHFARQDIYIANILKCRPPKNRDPLPEEINSCRSFLERQIEIIKPILICTLGRIATQALLGIDTPISRARGKVYNFKGTSVIPVYHPSYLLRNAGKKKEAWQDLQILRKVFDERKALP